MIAERLPIPVVASAPVSPTQSEIMMLGSMIQSVQQNQSRQLYLLRVFRCTSFPLSKSTCILRAPAQTPSFERARRPAIWGLLMLILGGASGGCSGVDHSQRPTSLKCEVDPSRAPLKRLVILREQKTQDGTFSDSSCVLYLQSGMATIRKTKPDLTRPARISCKIFNLKSLSGNNKLNPAAIASGH